MDKISLHIEYLLLKHDCVIIPGVGAFIKTHREAYIDRESGMLYPMGTEIHFNADIAEDDGLIANSYSRKYNISFSEARTMVKAEAGAMRDFLKQDSEITLGNLGILRAGDDMTLSFHPFLRLSSNSSRLGILPVRIPALHSIDSAGPRIEKPMTETYEESINKKCRKHKELDFERNYYIPVNKIFAKTAACLLLVIIAALSLFFPNTERVREDRASVVPVDTLIEKVVTKSTSASADKNQDVSASATETTDNASVPETKRYKLIVGTFSSESEAESYIESMKGCGYDLHNNPSGKLHRVSACSSDDASELYSLLNTKDFQKTFSESWVWQDKSACK